MVPEPEKPVTEALVTLKSPEVKLVVDSELVNVTVTELALLVPPFDTAVEEIDPVGPVLSYVQVNEEEAVLPFEAASENRLAGTEIEVAPSLVGVKVAL